MRGSISIFVNASNHSKIILTDDAAYIGSANFTFGSKQNFEAGICIFDRDICHQIYVDFFCTLMNESKQFLGMGRDVEFQLLHISKVTDELLESIDGEFETRDVVALRQLCTVIGDMGKVCDVDPPIIDLINGWRAVGLQDIKRIANELEGIRDEYGSCESQREFDADQYFQARFSEAIESSIENAIDAFSDSAGELTKENIDRQEKIKPLLDKLRPLLKALGGSLTLLRVEVEERLNRENV
jgi:hypothetical protein